MYVESSVIPPSNDRLFIDGVSHGGVGISLQVCVLGFSILSYHIQQTSHSEKKEFMRFWDLSPFLKDICREKIMHAIHETDDHIVRKSAQDIGPG